MTTTPTPLRDHVRLVDGPLEGRLFCVESTPVAETLPFEAAIDMQGHVLACEGEPAPVNVPFRGVTLTYAKVEAADGCWSRDDDGFLLMAEA